MWQHHRPLADIMPTGYEVGVLNGVVSPGDVVAVVGAGPIGLATIMGAKLFSPAHVIAIDLADSRLDAAKFFGADVVVNNGRENALEVIRELTDVTITTGLVDTYSTPILLKLIAGGQLDVGKFVTHRFALDDFMDAYDVFSRAADTGALKVVLARS